MTPTKISTKEAYTTAIFQKKSRNRSDFNIKLNQNNVYHRQLEGASGHQEAAESVPGRFAQLRSS